MKHRQSISTSKHPNATASLFWRALLTRTSRSGLAALALSGSFPMAGALRADPLPTGQQIERGNGTVSSDANTLTVKTLGRAVISWQSFNIGVGKVVDFQNDKAILNYVRRGGGSSQIDGTLRATNPIILLNNQGITVGSTAVISVPSILLSTGSLLPDSMDKFIQGANYGNGLNAPLIGIQLSNGDGPISVDGVIRSTDGGGIGLIAPSLSVGPNAKIRSTGNRSAATGTDGVNTTVNGVAAKGTLWLGTTALSPTSYTQPIPGMPGSSVPTLPTGFGFTQVGGRPSPQSIKLSLQATYDFERVVIGSSGATAGQFDSLFFSPNFRAADFYVYDGIQAIEEGHRQATSGGLRRTLTNTQTNQLIDDQLESTILGLQLPQGASLLSAEDVTVDANGQLQSGTLLIDPPASVSSDFVNQFGSGAFKISLSGGQATLEGGNGVRAAYDLSTGQVSWTTTVTTPGQPTTTTQIVAGSAIAQGTSAPPDGLAGTPGTQATFVARDEVPGTEGHSWQPCHTGNSGCKGGSPAVNGQVTYWNGHFHVDASGRQTFVPDTGAQASTHVVYMVGGRYYVTTRDNFNPSTTPKSPPSQVITPTVSQTVTIPGVPQQETRTFVEVFPIRGKSQAPTGSVQSSWSQPSSPAAQGLVPTPTAAAPTAAPTPLPYNIPDPTLAPPSPAPTRAPSPTAAVPTQAPTLAPQPTTAVVKPIAQPSFTGYAPVPSVEKRPEGKRTDGSGKRVFAIPEPTVAPTPTAAPKPTPAVPMAKQQAVPTPTIGVVKPIPQPSFTGYGRVPSVEKRPEGKRPDRSGKRVYAVPEPTVAPTPTPAVPMAKPQAVPTPTTGVVQPMAQPSFTGYGRVPSVEKRPEGKRPDRSGKRVYAVPEPTVAPTPTVAPKPTPAVPMAKPQAVPTQTTTPLQPTAAGGALPAGTQAPERPRAVLKPAATPEVASLLAADTASRRRGTALSYEVPMVLIDANVRGGVVNQSRASLADGRPLPDGLTYDPTSHTFTIKDTNEVPLPIDVRLTMPTRTGGQGAFVLTIGSP